MNTSSKNRDSAVSPLTGAIVTKATYRKHVDIVKTKVAAKDIANKLFDLRFTGVGIPQDLWELTVEVEALLRDFAV